MASENIQHDCMEVSGQKPPQEPNKEVVTLLKGPSKTLDKENGSGQPIDPDSGSRVSTAETKADNLNQNATLSNPDGHSAESLNAKASSELSHSEPRSGPLNLGTGQSVEKIVSTPGPAFDNQRIIKSINRNIKDTKRELDDLHKTLLPKERQLLVKKEETALEVSKYFAEIKVKVGKYLLEQEQKIQQELENLSDKESRHLRQDVIYCSKLMETVVEKETLLSMETRGRSDETLTTSDLCDLRRTVSGYYDVCSQMKTYVDEPFEMRFMINTDLEDMLTNCDLVTIELISARHTVQSHPSVSSVSSSIAPSTSDEPETKNDDKNASDVSDSESSVSSESEEEEESSEEEEDDDDDSDDDDNQDCPSVFEQIQPSQSRATSSNANPSVINSSNSASSQPPTTGRHNSSEDEPPPPYPGLPYAFTTGNVSTSSDCSRVQNRPDGHGTRHRGHPMVAVYPPEANTSARTVNNSGTERESGDFSLTPHAQESRQSPRYRRRQSPDSLASSGSGSSASLQETPTEPSGGNNPSRPKSKLNERPEDSEQVHPALLLPSSANPDPSAPPLPPSSFLQPSVNDRRDLSSLYPHLPHASQRSPGRSPVMGRRYPRATQVPSQGEQHRPSRRFREKTYNPPFTVKLVDRCNTAISADERPPGLVGISNMSEYTVVVDRWNCKLKLLKGRSVKSVLFFGTYEPWDVTGLSDTKCAVTVPKASEICFATRQGSKLKLEKRVPTARGYACIQYHRRRDVFICGCCPQYGRPHVAIVAMDGIVIKSFHDDTNKEPIFSYPRSVAIVGEDVIVVADNNKNCVIFLKMDGTVLKTYKGHSNSWLQDAQGVAVHPYRGYVIVSDAKKNSLHVLSSKGEYRGCIPSDSEMTSPRRLMMVGLNNPQLLVAHGNGYVSRFDLISDS